MDSRAESAAASVPRQKASVASVEQGMIAASNPCSCGVISAKPSSHKPASASAGWFRAAGSCNAAVAKSSAQFASCNACSFSQPAYSRCRQARSRSFARNSDPSSAFSARLSILVALKPCSCSSASSLPASRAKPGRLTLPPKSGSSA